MLWDPTARGKALSGSCINPCQRAELRQDPLATVLPASFSWERDLANLPVRSHPPSLGLEGLLQVTVLTTQIFSSKGVSSSLLAKDTEFQLQLQPFLSTRVQVHTLRDTLKVRIPFEFPCSVITVLRGSGSTLLTILWWEKQHKAAANGGSWVWLCSGTSMWYPADCHLPFSVFCCAETQK